MYQILIMGPELSGKLLNLQVVLEMNYRLDEVELEKEVKVIGFEGDASYEFKFISLGILPGDIIKIKSRSLLGGPLSVKHGDGHFFALRKSYAHKIIVTDDLGHKDLSHGKNIS